MVAVVYFAVWTLVCARLCRYHSFKAIGFNKRTPLMLFCIGRVCVNACPCAGVILPGGRFIALLDYVHSPILQHKVSHAVLTIECCSRQ
jgi:hypothetical protein